MNQCKDLDIAEQYKHDSKGILDGSHILVDNLVVRQAFQKHMNIQHDPRLCDTLNLDHKHPTNMDLYPMVYLLLLFKCNIFD